MVRADAGTGLSLHRDGPVLRLTGTLDRVAATAAWPALLPLLDGTRTVDLSGVQRLDSAGLALLAEAVERLDGPEIVGTPAGLAELRAAYRLDAALGFPGPAP